MTRKETKRASKVVYTTPSLLVGRKTKCWPTDRPADRPTDGPTDRLIDRSTYRNTSWPFSSQQNTIWHITWHDMKILTWPKIWQWSFYRFRSNVGNNKLNKLSRLLRRLSPSVILTNCPSGSLAQSLCVCLRLCLSVSLSVSLKVYMFVCPSVTLYVCMSLSLGVYVTLYLSVRLSVFLSDFFSVYLPVDPFVVFCLSVCLPFSLSIRRSGFP